MIFDYFRFKIGTRWLLTKVVYQKVVWDDIVQREVAVRDQLKDDAERLKVLSAQAQVARYFQRVAPLRNHLRQLSAPLDELLERFAVRELFEEVQSKYWQDGIIATLRPENYLKFLQDLDPKNDSIFLRDKGYVNILDLSDSDNYRDSITSLVGKEPVLPHLMLNGVGYGLAIKRTYSIQRDRLKWVMFSPGYSSFGGPGVGLVSRSSASYGWEKTGYRETVNRTKAIIVQTIESESQENVYDLSYSVSETEPDREDKFLTRPVLISSDQPPRILRELVGAHIASELAG